MIEIEPPFLVIKPDLSEDDFYRLAGEDSDWEYIDGRVVMHSPASPRHERLFRFLLFLLEGFLARRGGGEVFGSRLPMRLDPGWSPEPDLLFVRDDRRHLIGENRVEGPGDLVIEIVSRGDSHLVYREKLPRYRDAGIPEIWIVDPIRGEVLVDRIDASGERAASTLKSGRLASSVVPGFWIETAWLWTESSRSSMDRLEEILASR